MQYLSLTDQQAAPWLALDDNVHFFQDQNHLVLCSPETGFDDVAAVRLQNELMVKCVDPTTQTNY